LAIRRGKDKSEFLEILEANPCKHKGIGHDEQGLEDERI
jgi:hypothetical protein